MALTLRQEVAHEISHACLYPAATIADRSKQDISRYRRMLELLGLPLDTELVLATLSDEQCHKLLAFLQLYNKPNKSRYDWITLEAMFEEEP